MNEELLKALKSLISDIEAMRIGQTEIFGQFEHYQEESNHDDWSVAVEWPNLAISLADVKTKLAELEKVSP